MRTYPSLIVVLVSSLLLAACDSGSSSSRSRVGSVDQEPVPPPPTEPPTPSEPPGDYDMPPLVDVLQPDTDFEMACSNIVAPGSPVPTSGDTAGASSGALIDSAVAGVAYSTPSIQGVTNAEGGFLYQGGEAVRFTLGDTLLGEVSGSAQVTPFDLAGSAVRTGMPAITAALRNDENPFHGVINTAVLLQSLDEDGNPANGITVTPEVAALLEAVNLDTSQPWSAFQDDYWLTHTLAAANTQDLFSVPHEAVNPARALAHLYVTLGIDAGTYGISVEESDRDGDGTPDDVMRWQYDADGNVVRAESSYGGDIASAIVESWTYDANGKPTVARNEVFGEEVHESWSYNPNADLAEHESDEIGAGAQRWTYQHDADGKILLAQMKQFQPEEPTPSTTLVTFQYNSNDERSRIEFTGDFLRLAAEQLNLPTIDFLELGKTYTITYMYNANGLLWAEQLDGENPEVGYHRVSHRYDTQGNLTHYEGRLLQYGFDTEEQVTLREYRYEYDKQGNVKEEWVDSDGDGKPEEITGYEYDSQGRVIREYSDWDVDGEPDNITSYSYDQHGALLSTEWDYDVDGVPDEIQSWPYEYEYDDSGRIARRTLELNGDDQPEEILSYTYYSDGALAEEELQSKEVGTLDLTTWQYDALGNLLRQDRDFEGDGLLDETNSYNYDACGSLKMHQVYNDQGALVADENWQRDSTGKLRRHEWNNLVFFVFNDEEPFPAYPSGSPTEGLASWQYDTEGRVIRYQTECKGDCFVYWGGGPEELGLRTVNTEYDDADRVTRELVDTDGDGRANQVTVTEYDGAGNVTRELFDENGNGSANQVEIYAFDDNGNLLREEKDHNGDGRIDSLAIMEYDARGNIISEFSDDNNDGTAEESATFEHQYDAAGNHTWQEEDWTGDGVADRLEDWTYNASGRLVRYWQDETDDGMPASTETREYDANGNLVREEMDENSDGLPEWIWTYQYDANGNLVGESGGPNFDGDDIPDELETRLYVPTGWGHILAEPPEY